MTDPAVSGRPAAATSSIPAWLVALLLAAGCILLNRMLPESVKQGCWTHAAVLNWQEYGWGALGGKAAFNAGGHGLPDAPEFYTGHFPICLLPPFLLDWPNGESPHNTMLFSVVVALAAAAAAWLLLGRTAWGAAAAMAVAFSAGVHRMVAIYDPLAVPVLLGYPVICFAAHKLGAAVMRGRDWAILLGVVGLYACLNWTTAMLLGVMMVHLLVLLRDRPGRWWAFASALGLAVLMLGGISLAHKTGGGRPFSVIFNTYLFGPIGYDGHPMNAARAFLRIGAANAVGMLPLWLLWLRALPRLPLARAPSTHLPLLAAAAGIAVMRNYFAQHPWMSIPVLAAGQLCTLSLMARAGALAAPPWSGRRAGNVLFGLASLAWAMVLILGFHANIESLNNLKRLVAAHTERRDVLLVDAEADAWLWQNRKVLQEVLDRRMERVDGAPLPPGRRGIPLTAHADRGEVLAGTASLPRPPGLQLYQGALRWYRDRIAKRAPGDRLDTAMTHYLLAPRAPNPAPPAPGNAP